MIEHFIFEIVFKTRNRGYKILITLFELIGTPVTVMALMNIFFSIVVASLVIVLIDNISFIYQA